MASVIACASWIFRSNDRRSTSGKRSSCSTGPVRMLREPVRTGRSDHTSRTQRRRRRSHDPRSQRQPDCARVRGDGRPPGGRSRRVRPLFLAPRRLVRGSKREVGLVEDHPTIDSWLVCSLVTGPLVGLDEKVQPAGFYRVELSQVVVSQRDVQVQPKRPIQRYRALVCNGLEP